MGTNELESHCGSRERMRQDKLMPAAVSVRGFHLGGACLPPKARGDSAAFISFVRQLR